MRRSHVGSCGTGLGEDSADAGFVKENFRFSGYRRFE